MAKVEGPYGVLDWKVDLQCSSDSATGLCGCLFCDIWINLGRIAVQPVSGRSFSKLGIVPNSCPIFQ